MVEWSTTMAISVPLSCSTNIPPRTFLNQGMNKTESEKEREEMVELNPGKMHTVKPLVIPADIMKFFHFLVRILLEGGHC